MNKQKIKQGIMNRTCAINSKQRSIKKYIENWSSGNIRKIVSLKEGKEEGPCRIYFDVLGPNDSLKLWGEGHYKNSKKEGRWFAYYFSGNVQTYWDYQNGHIKDGEYPVYPSGVGEIVKNKYINGKLKTGNIDLYWPDGGIRERYSINNYEKEGRYLSRPKFDTEISGAYHLGRKTGLWIINTLEQPKKITREVSYYLNSRCIHLIEKQNKKEVVLFKYHPNAQIIKKLPINVKIKGKEIPCEIFVFKIGEKEHKMYFSAIKNFSHLIGKQTDDGEPF